MLLQFYQMLLFCYFVSAINWRWWFLVFFMLHCLDFSVLRFCCMTLIIFVCLSPHPPIRPAILLSCLTVFAELWLNAVAKHFSTNDALKFHFIHLIPSLQQQQLQSLHNHHHFHSMNEILKYRNWTLSM